MVQGLLARAVDDPRLSFRARGVLAYMVVHPDVHSSDVLVRRGREGRDAIRQALRELEAGGYITRSVARDAGGKLRTVTALGGG